MKIRRVLIVSFLCMSVSGCAQKTSNKKKEISMETIQSIPNDNKIIYAIHINAKTPYEIFIDDIPLPKLGRFYSSGMNTTLELNPYLLKNGKHRLKVRYLPLETANDSLLHPDDVYQNKDAKWNIFFVRYRKDAEDPLGYEGEIDYGNSELEVVPPPEPVPFWEQQFELDIKDLPFEQTGWSKSVNLNDMDRNILEEEVFAFFEKLRQVMDDGDFTTFSKLNERRDTELAISIYDEEKDWYTSDKRTQSFIETCKNRMVPIDRGLYRVQLYANGKLVTIERLDKFKNMALLAKDDEGYYTTYTYKIHKPSEEDGFEIIRF